MKYLRLLGVLFLGVSCIVINSAAGAAPIGASFEGVLILSDSYNPDIDDRHGQGLTAYTELTSFTALQDPNMLFGKPFESYLIEHFYEWEFMAGSIDATSNDPRRWPSLIGNSISDVSPPQRRFSKPIPATGMVILLSLGCLTTFYIFWRQYRFARNRRKYRYR